MSGPGGGILRSMDERSAMARFARRARARLAVVRGAEWTQRAVFYALVLALLGVLAHRFLGLRLPALWASAALGAAALAAGVLASLFPRIGLLQAAARVDARAGWKERLSSALALPAVDHPMERALVEDVNGRLGRCRPSDLFPLRATREAFFAPLAVLAIVGALFLPVVDLFGIEARRKEKEEGKKEIDAIVEKLEKRKKELEKAEQMSEKVKDAVRQIDALAAELQKTPPPDRKDALAQISKLSDELKKLKNDLAHAQAVAEKLQKALSKDAGETGELGKMIREGKFAEAAQMLAKMRNALQEGKLTPEQKEKLQKQMEALAAKMGKDKDLSDFEKKLAQALQGLQQNSELQMDPLQQALEGLESQLDDAEALAEALKDLQDLTKALARTHKECPS